MKCGRICPRRSCGKRAFTWRSLLHPRTCAQVSPQNHLQRLENWPRLIALREEVLKALEVARQEKFIGGSLEARVVLAASGELLPLVEEYRDFLR